MLRSDKLLWSLGYKEIDGIEKIDGTEKIDGVEKIGGLLLV